MIYINGNSKDELIIGREDLVKCKKIEKNKSDKRFLEKTYRTWLEEEFKNGGVLLEMRVLRESRLGKYMFNQAREEIKANPDDIIDSLIFQFATMNDESMLDNFGEYIKREQKNPSDKMVEEILSRRMGASPVYQGISLCK